MRSLIIEGYNKPLRAFNETERGLIVNKQVMIIAEKYGDRKALEPSVIRLIANDILANWSHFGPEEIFEAFNMWAKGDITGNGAEMYGGEINALVVNRILKAYQVTRNKILAEEHERLRIEKLEQESMEKAREWNRKLDLMKDHEIKAEVEKCESWEQIPKWVLDQISKRKMIRMDKSMQAEYMMRAKEIVYTEIEKERENARMNPRMAMAEIEGNIEGRVQLVYARLITFENL